MEKYRTLENIDYSDDEQLKQWLIETEQFYSVCFEKVNRLGNKRLIIESENKNKEDEEKPKLEDEEEQELTEQKEQLDIVIAELKKLESLEKNESSSNELKEFLTNSENWKRLKFTVNNVNKDGEKLKQEEIERKANLSPKIKEQMRQGTERGHSRRFSLDVDKKNEKEITQKINQYLTEMIEGWEKFLEIKKGLESGEITRKPFDYEIHEDNISYIEQILPLIKEIIETNTKENLKNLLDNWTNNYPNWNDKVGGWKGRIELFLEVYDESVKKPSFKSNESSGEAEELKKSLIEKLDLNPETTEAEILTALNIWFSSLEEDSKQVRKSLVNYAGLLSQEINKLEIIISKVNDEDKKTISKTKQENTKKELANVVKIGKKIKTSQNQTYQANIQVDVK